MPVDDLAREGDCRLIQPRSDASSEKEPLSAQTVRASSWEESQVVKDYWKADGAEALPRL